MAVLIVDKNGKIWRSVASVGAASSGSFTQIVPVDTSYDHREAAWNYECRLVLALSV